MCFCCACVRVFCMCFCSLRRRDVSGYQKYPRTTNKQKTQRRRSLIIVVVSLRCVSLKEESAVSSSMLPLLLLCCTCRALERVSSYIMCNSVTLITFGIVFFCVFLLRCVLCVLGANCARHLYCLSIRNSLLSAHTFLPAGFLAPALMFISGQG